jgi:hypothetical protein
MGFGVFSTGRNRTVRAQLDLLGKCLPRNPPLEQASLPEAEYLNQLIGSFLK